MFWSFATFENIRFKESSRVFDFCAGQETGVTTYFTDRDGSLSPRHAKTTKPSTLLSNVPNMLHFVNESRCTEYPENCNSYCPDAVFSTIRYDVDPSSSDEFVLRVCKRGDLSDCADFEGHKRRKDMGQGPTWAGRRMHFSAHMPLVGQYDAMFMRDGMMSWPTFALVEYQSLTLGEQSFQEGQVNLLVPPVSMEECRELIHNGDFELSTEPESWLHIRKGKAVVVAPGKGVAGSNGLTIKKQERRVAAVQYLDTRCIRLMEGQVYEIQAKVKMIDKEENAYNCLQGLETCPELGYSTDSNSNLAKLAGVVSGLDVDGFQTMHTLYRVDSTLVNDATPGLYITLDRVEFGMVIDEVSMRWVGTAQPSEGPSLSPSPTQLDCSNLVVSPGRNEGWQDYWFSSGAGTFNLYEGHDSSTAFKYGDRQSYYDGPNYRLDGNATAFGYAMKCMIPGSKWEVRAMLKLVNRVSGGAGHCLTMFNCPQVQVTVRDDTGGMVAWKDARGYSFFFWQGDHFNAFQTEIQIPEDWQGGPISSLSLTIASFPAKLDLIVDELTMSRIE